MKKKRNPEERTQSKRMAISIFLIFLTLGLLAGPFLAGCGSGKDKAGFLETGPFAAVKPSSLLPEADVSKQFGLSSFSPTGDAVIFTDPAQNKVFLRRADGSITEWPNVTPKGWNVYPPLWSPNGKALASAAVDANRSSNGGKLFAERLSDKKFVTLELHLIPLAWLDDQTLIVQLNASPPTLASIKPFSESPSPRAVSFKSGQKVGMLEGIYLAGGSYYAKHWPNGPTEPMELVRLQVNEDSLSMEVVLAIPRGYDAARLLRPSPSGTRWAVMQYAESGAVCFVSSNPDLEMSSDDVKLAEGAYLELWTWSPDGRSLFLDFFSEDKTGTHSKPLSNIREFAVP